jgi:hypothetical protein
MGHPSATRGRSIAISLDPERKAKIVATALEEFEKRRTLKAAAQAVGVGREALKKWIESDPAWREEFLEIDRGITDDIEAKGFDLCAEGDQRMVAFMLERRSDRYRARLEVQTKETLTIESVADRFRQAALANPTLMPTIKRALQLALEKLP